MKLLTNKEIWIWILASLLVINLAATVTILWKQNKYEHKSYKKHDRDKTKDKIFKKGFTKWHESMGFTEEQTKNLKELRNEFKTNSEEIFSQLNENQRMIFLELDSDEPNLTRLDSLMEITGNIHTNLRRQSVLIVHARLQLQAPGIHTEISNTNAHKEAILSFSVLLISVLPELQPN